MPLGGLYGMDGTRMITVDNEAPVVARFLSPIFSTRRK